MYIEAYKALCRRAHSKEIHVAPSKILFVDYNGKTSMIIVTSASETITAKNGNSYEEHAKNVVDAILENAKTYDIMLEEEIIFKSIKFVEKGETLESLAIEYDLMNDDEKKNDKDDIKKNLQKLLETLKLVILWMSSSSDECMLMSVDEKHKGQFIAGHGDSKFFTCFEDLNDLLHGLFYEMESFSIMTAGYYGEPKFIYLFKNPYFRCRSLEEAFIVKDLLGFS